LDIICGVARVRLLHHEELFALERAFRTASRVKTVGGGLLGRTSLGVLAAGARDDLLDPRNLCGPIACSSAFTQSQIGGASAKSSVGCTKNVPAMTAETTTNVVRTGVYSWARLAARAVMLMGGVYAGARLRARSNRFASEA
jgi:hypothetical protein